ncbi:hypothetical protein CEP52_016432 [Fusarium oligoseptatum]|uniref:J domain-containing protein n=1 Tax=Fusarium oligoseptatum TaxID=2604345 RepID=A0A428S3Q9_9HYPO|nr:hypothetical protein CEP52_016432 [Fusarium oligoseptatum]
MDEDTDYYRILEVDDSADEATIKQAVKANYRRLAREHHPDKNPGDKNATARFQKIQHAFDILSNDGKRKEPEKLSSSGIDSSNMTGNADNRSINVDKKNNGASNKNEETKKRGVNERNNIDNKKNSVDDKKNNGDSNRNEERKKHGVNERNNAREMNNVVKTRNAGMTNNSAPGSNVKPERTQKENLILTLGNRGAPNLESQRP